MTKLEKLYRASEDKRSFYMSVTLPLLEKKWAEEAAAHAAKRAARIKEAAQ